LGGGGWLGLCVYTCVSKCVCATTVDVNLVRRQRKYEPLGKFTVSWRFASRNPPCPGVIGFVVQDVDPTGWNTAMSNLECSGKCVGSETLFINSIVVGRSA
jgi:hypothetical protein